jgi:hypothetical protein
MKVGGRPGFFIWLLLSRCLYYFVELLLKFTEPRAAGIFFRYVGRKFHIKQEEMIPCLLMKFANSAHRMVPP